MDRTILKISIAVGLSIFFTACIKSYTIKYPDKPIEIGQSPKSAQQKSQSNTTDEDVHKDACDIKSSYQNK
ncbi:hypothetical protein ACWIT3_09345 [Pasteurella sp. P03HT]